MVPASPYALLPGAGAVSHALATTPSPHGWALAFRRSTRARRGRPARPRLRRRRQSALPYYGRQPRAWSRSTRTASPAARRQGARSAWLARTRHTSGSGVHVSPLPCAAGQDVFPRGRHRRRLRQVARAARGRVPRYTNLAVAGRWRLALARGERARWRPGEFFIACALAAGSSRCILPSRATAPGAPSAAAAAAVADVDDTDAAGTDTAAAMAASYE